MPSWSEKELEDWLMHGQNLWYTLDELGIGDRSAGGSASRQVTTDAGIVDILARLGRSLFVIELKSCQADGNALAQVLAYKHCVEAIARQADCWNCNVYVFPVIIAPSFDKRLIAAAEEAEVRLIEVGASFSFREDCSPVFGDDHCFDEQSRAFELALQANEFAESGKRAEEDDQQVIDDPEAREPEVREEVEAP